MSHRSRYLKGVKVVQHNCNRSIEQISMNIKKIACCIDFSENAEDAFITALDLAEKNKAKLFVIHVSPPVISYQATDTEWMMPYEPEEPLILELERIDQENSASHDSDND